MSNQSRIEFEAWAATKGMAMHLARAESGLYVSRVTQNYMDCWMASQAEQAGELEALREFKRHMVEMREAEGFKSWAEVLVTVDQLKAEVEALRAARSSPTPEQMLEMGENYWVSRRRSGLDIGAVKWVQDEQSGSLLIFTRGEYREHLLSAVMAIEPSMTEEACR